MIDALDPRPHGEGALRAIGLATTATTFLVLSLLAACGDSSSASPNDPRIELEDGWIVVVQIRGGDEVTAAILVEDPTADGDLDLSDGLSIPGRGEVFASPFEDGVIFALDGEAPRLTRYRVSPSGQFEEEGTLAFLSFTPPRNFVPSSFPFASETKGYIIDPLGAQVIIYDPTTMTTIGTVDVPTDLVPGLDFFPAIGYDVLRLQGHILVSVGFINTAAEVISPRSLILLLDPETDTIDRVFSTETCGYLRHGRLTANGSVLLGSDVFTTSLEWTSEGLEGGPVCVLRINSDLEVTAVAPPNALTDDVPGGTFIFVSDTAAFVRVLDESAAPPRPITSFELNAGSYWRWGFISGIGSEPTFRLVDESPLSPAFSTATERFDEDRRLVIDRGVDLSSTTIVQLRPDGSFTPGLRSTQIITNVFPVSLR
ncbi:MAG: hypothetical protein AAGF12_22840 [Myxococcota bacterium]